MGAKLFNDRNGASTARNNIGMKIWERLFGRSKPPQSPTGPPSTAASSNAPGKSLQIEGHPIVHVADADPPIRVNPSLVKCGFCIYPHSMAKLMTPDRLHQAIETNQNTFWKAVRRANPQVKIIDMMVQSDEEVDNFMRGLRAMKLLDGNSVAVGVMQINPDPRTLSELRVGFVWPEQSPRIIITRPGGIVPG